MSQPTTPEDSGVSPKTQPGIIAARLEEIRQELYELRHQAKELSFFASAAIGDANHALANAIHELVGSEPVIKTRFLANLSCGTWFVLDAKGHPIASEDGKALTRETAHALAERLNSAIELREAAGRG